MFLNKNQETIRLLNYFLSQRFQIAVLIPVTTSASIGISLIIPLHVFVCLNVDSLIF